MPLNCMVGLLLGFGIGVIGCRLRRSRWRYSGSESKAVYAAREEAAEAQEYLRRWHTGGGDYDASANAGAGYAGYAKPAISHLSEPELVVIREGHHVLFGRTGAPLKPNFLSAHEAKRHQEQQLRQTQRP